MFSFVLFVFGSAALPPCLGVEGLGATGLGVTGAGVGLGVTGLGATGLGATGFGVVGAGVGLGATGLGVTGAGTFTLFGVLLKEGLLFCCWFPLGLALIPAPPAPS